jgi:sugar phosphate isomerase/epimerase
MVKHIMHMRSNRKISRRRFIPLAGGALAAAAFSQQTRRGHRLPVGIQLYMVNADLTKDPVATLKKLAEIGYSEVETAGFGKLSAAQFRDLLRDAGLRAPSAHLGFGMDDTDKLLDDVKTLGADYAVSSILPAKNQGIPDFFKNMSTMTADDFRRMAAHANEIGQKVKAAGMQYAYHNHNFEFREVGDSKTGYHILLEETDASVVKFETDCGWMKVGGKDPVEYLKQHGNRIAMLHAKNFKNITTPVTQLFSPDRPISTELGRGSIDYKPIVEAGLKAGVKHIFVEQEPPFKDVSVMEAADIDYRYLKSLLS